MTALLSRRCVLKSATQLGASTIIGPNCMPPSNLPALILSARNWVCRYMICSVVKCGMPCPSPVISSFTMPILTPDWEKSAQFPQLVEYARALKAQHGFTTHKLKGGVFPPEYELGVLSSSGRGVSHR